MKKLSKHTVCILIFLLSVHFSHAQTDRAEFDLRGKVRSVFDVTYKLIIERNTSSNSNVKREEKSNDLKELYKFSKEGKLIEECRYNPDGTIYDKSVYVFDIDNKDMMTEVYRYKQDDHLYLKYANEYDENGNLCIRSIYTLKDTLSGKYVYSYDVANLNTEKSWYDSKGKLQHTYKIVRTGNKTEENLYDSEGELQQKKLCKTDSAGNTIEENFLNAEGTSERKYSCKYDSTGNKFEENLYNSGVLIYTIMSLFNEAGLRIEDTKTEYTSDGTIYLTKRSMYTYDDQNNWIKKTIFENEIPRFVVERKIKYYK